MRRRAGDQALPIGDAVYTLRSIETERLPLMTADDAAYLRSLGELKAFGERAPGAILVPSHDPSAWRRLGGDGGP